MTLGPAMQKVLALAILVGVAFALWAGGLMPLKEGYERDRAMANQSAALIARYRVVLAGMPPLKKEVARLRAHPVLKRGLFVAPSPEMGAASLQGRIKASAASAGAKLISIQVLATKEEAGFSKIGVRTRLSGDVEALSGLLYRLQTAWPALVVDTVSVRARTRRQRTKRGSPSRLIVMSDLTIRFDVHGFMAREGDQASLRDGGGSK